ncbi:MAG: ATP phosphoribosyltransferase regulatory subunit, partial [Pseudomonadota bacterium]|nr:ATP phosphoribosyltransferase regulatory subunit [Pseudomonadota bacterium]
HAGLEADLEAAELALDCLQFAPVGDCVIDLADARLLRGVLAGVPLDALALQDIVQALSEKDASAVTSLSKGAPGETQQALGTLLRLYGGDEVLETAARLLPERPLIRKALDDLRWLATQLRAAFPDLQIGFDLSEMSGYAYYSGPRFAIYGAGQSQALARGGRYDEIGAIFGRNRPAVGFGLDLKSLAELAGDPKPAKAIRAPWNTDAALRAAVRRLRDSGESVVAMPLEDSNESHTVACDRELVHRAGHWTVQPLST